MSRADHKLRTRALILLQRTPGGLLSKDVARALRITQATAAAMLARAFWRGALDRDEVPRQNGGPSFRYRIPSHDSRKAAVED